jgi:branched-chain amino acid transport system substrate-binding protein
MRAYLLLGLGLVTGSCSFTTATGFDECQTDVDCGATSVCVQGYCLPLPEACQRAEGVFDAANRIPVALIAPLTTADGGANDREVYRLDAVRLALGELNGRGGLGNQPYGLFACDATLAAPMALSQWLVGSLQVPALIVSGSTRMSDVAGEPTRVDAGTFVISPNATDAALVAKFQSDGNLWRVAPPDTLQARVLRRHVVSALAPSGGTRVALVTEDSDYGRSFRDALVAELIAAGYLTNDYQFPPGLDLPQAASTLAQLDAALPPAGVVVVGFPADVVQLVTAASAKAYLRPDAGERWFFTDSAKDPSIVTPATRGFLTGMVGTAPAQGQGQVAFATFSSGFVSRFGVNPNAYSFTAHSYDAMWLVAAATAYATQNQGPITGPRMKGAIAHLEAPVTPLQLSSGDWNQLSLDLSEGQAINVNGASGPLDFDLDAGAPSSPYELWTVADGGIVTLGYEDP